MPAHVAESLCLSFSSGPFYGPCTAPAPYNAGHFRGQGPCTAPAGAVQGTSQYWHHSGMDAASRWAEEMTFYDT